MARPLDNLRREWSFFSPRPKAEKLAPPSAFFTRPGLIFCAALGLGLRIGIFIHTSPIYTHVLTYTTMDKYIKLVSGLDRTEPNERTLFEKSTSNAIVPMQVSTNIFLWIITFVFFQFARSQIGRHTLEGTRHFPRSAFMVAASRSAEKPPPVSRPHSSRDPELLPPPPSKNPWSLIEDRNWSGPQTQVIGKKAKKKLNSKKINNKC